MASPTEIAARTYAAAWNEPDPDERVRMIEACFAPDGRIATSAAGIAGQAALVHAMSEFRASGCMARIADALDVQGRKFRFHSIVEQPDGRTDEFFDAGEVDASNRIAVLITFRGAMPTSS